MGVALVDNEESSHALVLLEGLDYLLHVDLAVPSDAAQVDLEAPSVSIGAMPDGRFAIAHDSPLGLITFLNPETLEQQVVSGFAMADLLVDDTLPNRDGQE